MASVEELRCDDCGKITLRCACKPAPVNEFRLGYARGVEAAAQTINMALTDGVRDPQELLRRVEALGPAKKNEEANG